MKKIGIVVAVVREMYSFFNDNSFTPELIKVNHYDVYKVVINGNEIFLINSGFGEIDASAATQLLVTKFDCAYILNYGVVGALDKNLKVRELFLVDKVVHYDYDVSQIDDVKPHQYIEYSDEYIHGSEYLLDLAKRINPDLKEVICASGDRFIEDRKFKAELNSLYDASICDMESAGIARTAKRNKVEWLSIKAISDALDGDGKDYNENVIESSNQAFRFLKEILNNL